ncbi:hypothetical protein MIN45_P1496 [Methylomarinovum tepidoasis]|uniref:Doubled CXXCH motif domain-containing protein n=1 Tax=Methylomarinovum tepidoasis TaxID=2840183 RepID=A0AAU9CB28_9GAMM|nr:NHL repeat-containing protein [Methylomarinovum sp. IN45]BCX89126.1 hypothetical protein MIN45_P1496 [Methylomarinovum sp. IN45]
MRTILLLLLWLPLAPALAAPWPQVTKRAVVGRLPQPAAVAASSRALAALDAEGRLWRWPVGGGGKPAVKEYGFDRPLGLAPLEGGWLVADTGHGRLVWVGGDGAVKRQWPLTLPCLEAETPCTPKTPRPVSVAAVANELVWSDRNHLLCRIDRDVGALQGCVGGYGRMEGQFQYPFQIAVDESGFLLVADVLGGRVQMFDRKGRYFAQFGRFGIAEGELYRPNGVALDPQHGLAFVSDAYFGAIAVFHQGEPLGRLEDASGRPVILDTPSNLFYRDGKLYAAETGADRIVVLDLAFSEREPPAFSASGLSVSQKDCLLCHLEFAKEAPLEIRGPDELGQLPVARFRMCYSCHHGPVVDSRMIIRAGAQHPTLYDPELKRKKRPWPREDELPDVFPITEEHQLTCTSCHTPHTAEIEGTTLYPDHKNPWLRVPNPEGRLCERCHESKAKGARDPDDSHHGVNHPLGIRLRPSPYKGAPGYPADPGLTHGLPDSLRKAGGMLGPDDTLACQSCHQIHGGVSDDLLLLDDDRGQLCRQCHRRQFSRSKREARRKGVHPVNVKPEEKILRGGKRVRFVTCGSCHPVHDGKPQTPMLLKPAESLCQDCHPRQHAKDKDDARRKGVHPVNVTLEEPVTIAGQRWKKVGCLTCHAVHRGRPNTPALVEDHHDGRLCRHCHEDNSPVLGSDHDLRITAKDSRNHFDETPAQAGLCGACHTLHRGKGKWPYLYAAKIVGHPQKPAEDGDSTPFRRDQLCLNCHQDHPQAVAKDKVVKFFSHPHKDIVLRSEPDRIPLLDAREQDSETGAIGCTTCHDPHVWTPRHRQAKRPPLAANRKNLEGDPHSSFLRQLQPQKTFCLGCHGLEVREKYKYFHDDFVRGVVDYLR